MWVLLPVVAFGSAYVPEIGSFTASQAAFTMMVLIVFNLIVPTGLAGRTDPGRGRRGRRLRRRRRVAAAVAARCQDGGAAGHRRGTCDVGSRYLRAAVHRVTRGAFEQAENQVNALSHDALTASRTLDDAVRQYLSESSGPTTRALRWCGRPTGRCGCARPPTSSPTSCPPPLGVYPRAREVLETDTAAVCARLDGTTRRTTSLPPDQRRRWCPPCAPRPARVTWRSPRRCRW